MSMVPMMILRMMTDAVGRITRESRWLQMPELQMPLHTLIELEPRPDGTMVERRYKINIDATDDSKVSY